jgi:hypothetical protein
MDVSDFFNFPHEDKFLDADGVSAGREQFYMHNQEANFDAPLLCDSQLPKAPGLNQIL